MARRRFGDDHELEDLLAPPPAPAPPPMVPSHPVAPIAWIASGAVMPPIDTQTFAQQVQDAINDQRATTFLAALDAAWAVRLGVPTLTPAQSETIRRVFGESIPTTGTAARAAFDQRYEAHDLTLINEFVAAQVFVPTPPPGPPPAVVPPPVTGTDTVPALLSPGETPSQHFTWATTTQLHPELVNLPHIRMTPKPRIKPIRFPGLKPIPPGRPAEERVDMFGRTAADRARQRAAGEQRSGWWLVGIVVGGLLLKLWIG